MIQTLIQITPYQKMRPGLASTIVEALIDNLSYLDKIGNRDQMIRNEICSSINQALARADLITEIKAKLFDQDYKSKSCETLLNTMLKVQNFISNEKIAILLTLGKNYPEVLTYEWLRVSKN